MEGVRTMVHEQVRIEMQAAMTGMHTTSARRPRANTVEHEISHQWQSLAHLGTSR